MEKPNANHTSASVCCDSQSIFKKAVEKKKGNTFFTAVIIEDMMTQSTPSLLPLGAKETVVWGGKTTTISTRTFFFWSV